MLNQEQYLLELGQIKQQIIERYNPDKMYLFGSLAKGVINKNSDIDICIVKYTEDKRKLISDIYLHVDSSIPYDVIVYTPKAWEEHSKDSSSFVNKIVTEGKLLL